MGTNKIVVAELHFLAMTAKPAMAEFRSARSLIFLSATLSPMATIQHELGIPVTIAACMHAPVRQSTTIILKSGPTMCLRGTSLAFEDQHFLRNIMQVLLSIAESVPHGVLVFLPSYKALAMFRSECEHSTTFEMLRRKKTVFWESRCKSEFQETLSSFYADNDMAYQSKHANDLTGGILFAVCRGKVSEGIDFPDHYCRAVIMIGLPYAYFGDMFVQAKIKYNDFRISERLQPLPQSGNDWYDSDAFSAVNQATGRSIRHDKDWAAVILLDERYNGRIQRLPQWAQRNVFSTDSIDSFTEYLKSFISQQST